MPKLSCPCGTVIDLSTIPSPYGSKVIPERDFDAIRERLVAAGASTEALRTAVWTEVLGFQNPAIHQAYVCPTCGRLYLFARASDTEPAAVWALERGTTDLLVDRGKPDRQS